MLIGGMGTRRQTVAAPLVDAHPPKKPSTLQSIYGTKFLVRFTRPLVSGAGSVSAKHRPRSPACESHQVALVPPGGKPCVGELVSEQVRVEVCDTGLLAAPRH